MRFVIGKRWKNDKSKEFLLFYWLVLDICSTDFFISIARSFKNFFSDRERQNRQHLSLIDENQSFTLIGTNYSVMNNFQSLWKNHLQSYILLTLKSSLFIASRPVFCCLQAALQLGVKMIEWFSIIQPRGAWFQGWTWTQITTWKWNQSLVPKGVYSSRDSKH